MAAKIQSNTMYKGSSKTKRPGVHAKSKSSKNKNSKNYAKPYVAQGK